MGVFVLLVSCVCVSWFRRAFPSPCSLIVNSTFYAIKNFAFVYRFSERRDGVVGFARVKRIPLPCWWKAFSLTAEGGDFSLLKQFVLLRNRQLC